MRILWLLAGWMALLPMVSHCQKKRPGESAAPALMDQYIRQVLPQWNIPGISVAVVKDGSLVFSRAYGMQQWDRPDSFTTRTLSACASTTKAMTAVCVGMLVDEGKIKWESRLAEVLPEFRLKDPYMQAEITVKDLLTHNAGLGNGDWLWVFGYRREEILRRMGQMPPAYSMRSSFIYQNLMYLVAGELIKKVSGQDWEDFIEQRIFKPLGMGRTYPVPSRIPGASPKTAAHFMDQGKVRTIPQITGDNIGPAGGVWSCSEDMALWLGCLIDSTKFPGGRLLRPETFGQVFRPQVMAPQEMYPALARVHPHWFTYGLGWFQLDYRGRMVQFHTGSLPGLTALAGLVPDSHFGIYIFGNLDHAELRHALLYKAIDLWCFQDNGRDWNGEIFPLYTRINDSIKNAGQEERKNRIPGTQPSHPLPAYTGRFESPEVTIATIRLQDGQLVIDLPNEFQLVLSHWQYETFEAANNRWWFGTSRVKFEQNVDGVISGFNWAGMHFTRRP
jgi:CubicO group peptidase (beta-lactamase class C family)